MEYYSAFKRNGILIHAATWIHFENIMLSEKKRHKRTNGVILLNEVLRIGKFIETGSRTVLPEVEREEEIIV